MIYLETPRLILRDYNYSDCDAYIKLKSDAEVMYYLQDIMLNSYEEGVADFNDTLADMQRKNRTFYFLHIELKETHEQIGSIGYTVTDHTPAGKLVHLGYFTYKKFWGHGYTTEALKRLLAFAFTEDNVYRITTGCLKDNIASAAVMKKCGLIFEAEHIGYKWHDGEMKTRLEYRLLREEWKP